MFEIKKNVPIPRSTRKPTLEIPFNKVDVHDCLEIELSKTPFKTVRKLQVYVHASFRNYSYKYHRGYRIKTRSFEKNGKEILRIWRVS